METKKYRFSSKIQVLKTHIHTHMNTYTNLTRQQTTTAHQNAIAAERRSIHRHSGSYTHLPHASGLDGQIRPGSIKT